MARSRQREVLGLFLVLLGIAFFLVSSGLLRFGWEAVWPVIPLLIGLLLLRVYVLRRKPRQLFLGSLLVQFGVFLLLFSSGVLTWGAMSGGWPTVPLIVGISLVVLSGAIENAASSLVVGLAFVFCAVVGYLVAGAVIPPRLSTPFIRAWPLVLVAAGALVFARARRERREDDGPCAVGETGGEAADPIAAVVSRVRAQPEPESAAVALVRALAAQVAKYSWVGLFDCRQGGFILRVGAGEDTRGGRDAPAICAQVERAGETVIEAAASPSESPAGETPVASRIAVPVLLHDTLGAVFVVSSVRPDGGFHSADRRFLETILFRVRDVLLHDSTVKKT